LVKNATDGRKPTSDTCARARKTGSKRFEKCMSRRNLPDYRANAQSRGYAQTATRSICTNTIVGKNKISEIWQSKDDDVGYCIVRASFAVIDLRRPL